MYLSELKLCNFRKCGSNNDESGLKVPFNKGLNLLVGENDSVETAIIDSIKHILGKQSYDYQRMIEKDFYKSTNGKIRMTELKIECTFSNISSREAENYIEWLNFNEDDTYELQINLKEKMIKNRIVMDIRAGLERADSQLDGATKDY